MSELVYMNSEKYIEFDSSSGIYGSLPLFLTASEILYTWWVKMLELFRQPFQIMILQSALCDLNLYDSNCKWVAQNSQNGPFKTA